LLVARDLFDDEILRRLEICEGDAAAVRTAAAATAAETSETAKRVIAL